MGDVHRIEIPPTITGSEAPSKEKPSGQQANTVERPAWLPEKFWKDSKADYEGLAKSYGELEKKGTATKQPGDLSIGEKKPTGEDTPKAGEGDKAGDTKEDTVAKSSVIPGVTQEQSAQYWNELTNNGQLSEKSYVELEKQGYPKTVVDAYIRGIQAEQSQVQGAVSEIKKLAGGDEGYAAMAEWMSANLGAAELAEYNEAVNSGKKGAIKAAVQNMHNRYKAEMGEDPKLLNGQGNKPTGGDVFTSQAEVTAAMHDPRYKKDAAYRKAVTEKIGRS